MVDDNRAEGYRHANGAIPSAVVLSRQFEPSGNPGRPMTVEGMVSRASKAGFRNSDSPYTRFLFGRYSYQHLSEYYPAVLGNDAVPADFRNLYLVMQLDHDYQAILLRYIGMFELQLRARYSMEMSVKYGAFAHRKPSCFKNQRYYDKFLREYAKVHEACLSHSSSRAAKDIASYGDMPIWEAVEEMPFGMIPGSSKTLRIGRLKKVLLGRSVWIRAPLPIGFQRSQLLETDALILGNYLGQI